MIGEKNARLKDVHNDPNHLNLWSRFLLILTKPEIQLAARKYMLTLSNIALLALKLWVLIEVDSKWHRENTFFITSLNTS